MNSILITQPVWAFNSVIHMPLPVVAFHITQSSVDATLSCDRMWSGRKQFGDHCSLESFGDEAIGRTETSSAGANYYRIVCMIHYRILLGDQIRDLRSVVRRVVQLAITDERQSQLILQSESEIDVVKCGSYYGIMNLWKIIIKLYKISLSVCI